MRRWTRWLARECDELYDLGFRETGKPKRGRPVRAARRPRGRQLGGAARQARAAQRKVAPGLAMMNFDARVELRAARRRRHHHAVERAGVHGLLRPRRTRSARATRSIVKPSEFAAATGVYAVESFYKANPDAPEGLVTWITGFGETGSALCRSGVDKLGFTGSVPTGRRVMAGVRGEPDARCCSNSAARTRRSSPSDADLEAAAESVVWGSMWNAGSGVRRRRAGLRRADGARRVPAPGEGEAPSRSRSAWRTRPTSAR